jgi:hypothetical protein
MAVYEQRKRLFGIRVYPDSAPHVVVALLATSEGEAEEMARQLAGQLHSDAASFADAPTTLRECGEDDAVIVTFR